jgi:hypothetical protein
MPNNYARADFFGTAARGGSQLAQVQNRGVG